jgi:hypothetical protein
VIVTGADVVRQARTWLGTPFRHQGRLKGTGTDCAGLIIGVARELGLSDFDTADYCRQPDDEMLERLCRQQMRALDRDEVGQGDVWLIAVKDRRQHLAFATDHGILHAYALLRRVVEHRIDEGWRSRLLAGFRLPGVVSSSEAIGRKDIV